MLKCISLLKTVKNVKYQRILRQAGDLALSQGAHEMALRYFEACQDLLGDQWGHDDGDRDEEEVSATFKLTRVPSSGQLTSRLPDSSSLTGSSAFGSALRSCSRGRETQPSRTNV